MVEIRRDVQQCADEHFDLIIVGGGVYGIMLSLESGFRNKRSLLLESNDFGSATSFNHLRTIHGGLRYLQSMDLPRFFESIRERQWFFIHFPDFVKILPCVMPLFDKGVRRKSILKIALKINDRLSKKRNTSVIPEKHLPNGYILSNKETGNIFPQIVADGLKGSAVWFDGMITEPERLLMEILRWSCGMGAKALNYVHATGLTTIDCQTAGVKAYDKESKREFEFRAPIVINAAGPWNREVAGKFDKDYPSLFENYLLLWNILFNKKSISKFSLAVTPDKGSGHTYFIHDWKGRLLIGTGEEEVPGHDISGYPTPQQIQKFIGEIHSAMPSLSLEPNDIDHIYCGVLPADKNSRLTKREVILNHATHNGPKGLFSISGIKFTTSRLVAEKVLDIIFPEKKNEARRNASAPPAIAFGKRGAFPFDWRPFADQPEWLDDLRSIISEESVVHLDDLIFRRTNLGENKNRLSHVIHSIRRLFPWDDTTWEAELNRIFSEKHL